MTDPLPKLVRVLLLLAVGAWLGVALPPAVEVLAAPGVPILWWTARALGLAAQGALALTMLFGVFVGARGAGGALQTPVVAQLHARWSLAAVVLLAGHVTAVVVDAHAGVGALAVIVPTASPVRTGPVALGTVALWMLAAVIGTTALKKRLSAKAWRAVHATSFGAFLLAALHTVTAGTDAAAPGVRALLLGTVAAVVGAVAQRVLLATRPVAPRA